MQQHKIASLSVEDAARELTEAQRAFVLWLPADGSWRLTHERDMNRHGPNALRAFGQSGLIEGYYREVMKHRLTPKGQDVQAILYREQS